MQYEEILDKFLEVNTFPSKYTIKDVLGISPSTLRRMGIVVRELQILYRKEVETKTFCLFCGKECKKSNKFCNNSCSAKYNNKNKIKKIKYCLHCAKEMSGRGKYCSMQCHRKHEYDLYIKMWLSGATVGISSKTVPAPVRKYLFILYDSKCARCGWGEINPITGNSPLEVEHIDGDSSNNKVENLTLLCPNCHSLTPTYKALNKGNGRHSRRIRYKEGKSY